MRAAATIVLAATARVATAAPAPEIKVAVVPSVTVNIDVVRVDALCQDLAEALEAELEVEAVGGLEVRRLVPRGIPADCVASAPCVRDLATRLGVDQVLFVAMVDAGRSGAIQIDSLWVDTTTDQRASRPAITLAGVENAKARFVANARRLLPDAPVRQRPRASGVPGAMTPAVPRHITTPVVVAAGGVAVGLGVGLGFGLTARARYNECKASPCLADRTHSVKTLGLVADLGHLTWIVSAGLGAYFYWTSGEEPRFVVTPTSEGGAAAAVVGRF
jgi:hypothetical protein